MCGHRRHMASASAGFELDGLVVVSLLFGLFFL